MRTTLLLVTAVLAVGGCQAEWPHMEPAGSPVLSPRTGEQAATPLPPAQPPREARPVEPAVRVTPVAAGPVVAPPPAPAPAPAAGPVVVPAPAAPAVKAPAGRPVPVAAVSVAPARPAVRAASAPAAGAGEPALAMVNGKPLPLRKLTNVLIAAYGMPVAKDVIYLELVEQAAAMRGVTVTEADLREEHERTLRDQFGKVQVPREQWEQLFWQFMAQNNVSRGHWTLILRRTALLRRLAPEAIPVTEPEMREVYGKLYGQKVQVRHIARQSREQIEDTAARVAKGADFAQLAREVSVSNDREAGGLLPPFGRGSDSVPDVMRQMAFLMKEPGTISDIFQYGETYHILRLEKFIEPEVPYEKVKDEIVAMVRGEKVRLWGNKYLADLVKAADVEFVEPVLKAQYEQNLKAMKEQQEAAGKGPEKSGP